MSSCVENDSVFSYPEKVTKQKPTREILAPIGFAILLYPPREVQAGI